MTRNQSYLSVIRHLSAPLFCLLTLLATSCGGDDAPGSPCCVPHSFCGTYDDKGVCVAGKNALAPENPTNESVDRGEGRDQPQDHEDQYSSNGGSGSGKSCDRPAACCDRPAACCDRPASCCDRPTKNCVQPGKCSSDCDCQLGEHCIHEKCTAPSIAKPTPCNSAADCLKDQACINKICAPVPSDPNDPNDHKDPNDPNDPNDVQDPGEPKDPSQNTCQPCAEPPKKDPNGCVTNSDCPLNYLCTNALCRPYTPPSNACGADEHCSQGATCLDGKCVKKTICHGDTDCRADQFCLRGSCTSRCTKDTDCAGGLSCIDGKCHPEQSATLSCSASSDCAWCEVCTNNACVVRDTICVLPEQCGIEKTCVQQVCNYTCTDDTDCPKSHRCQGGVCGRNPDSSSHECQFSSQCDASRHQQCVEGYCFNSCATHSDCEAKEMCDLGLCKPDVRPGYRCRNNLDCESGAICHDAQCTTTCATDAECVSGSCMHGYCTR